MPDPGTRDPRIPLRDPLIAGILAWIIPGLGHLYQGRLFKSGVYFFCITGTFLTGLALGEWQISYYRRAPGNTTYGFYAQILAGLPALPAVIQARRYTPLTPQELDPPRNHSIEESLEAPFTGRLRQTENTEGSNLAAVEDVEGTLQLEPGTDENGRPLIRGTFIGRTASGTEVSLKVGDLPDGSRSSRLEIGPALFARDEVSYRYLETEDEGELVWSADRRYLTIPLLNAEGTDEAGRLEGTIPRPWWNWFSVPIEDAGLQDLHRNLSRQLELALVFTWIAGLLNLLAIWDAVEGPAYGFGDQYFQSISGGREASAPAASTASSAAAVESSGTAAHGSESAGTPAGSVQQPVPAPAEDTPASPGR
ncbi:MAG: hypothetical protein KDA79_08465 [Planctomycetaceae bacterium]|nr:hypothetical protein [Planctomycetaceae bacterium]